MKATITILTILFLGFNLSAQYQVGVPAYDTIYVGQYDSTNDCFPEEDVNIGLGLPEFKYVSGVC